MFIALTVFLVVFSVFLHELGHAILMRKYGIRIKTFSIGLPFPLSIGFSHKRILGGARIQLTPFLLGAYVQPEDEDGLIMEEFPYNKQADIFGAGPLANFIFSLVLMIGLTVGLVVQANVLNIGLLVTNQYFLGALVLLLILYSRPQIFSRYLMLPMGFLFLSFLLFSMISQPDESVSGPVGIGKMIGQASSLRGSIIMSAVLSLSIGMFNIIPLMPLDGGRAFRALIRPFPGFRYLFERSTLIFFFCLIGFAMLSDL